jgi:hypothetical protein
MGASMLRLTISNSVVKKLGLMIGAANGSVEFRVMFPPDIIWGLVLAIRTNTDEGSH